MSRGWGRRGCSLVAALALAIGGSLTITGLARADTPAASTSFQFDAAHDGTVPGAQLTGPLTPAWTTSFPGEVTNPISNGSMDYVLSVVAPNSNTSAVFALDAATGAIRWQHDLGGGGTGLTADGSQLFALEFGGELTAFDAATGAVDWSEQLPGQYAFSATPTATGGTVYISGSGTGGTLYAVNESDGSVRWSQTVNGGDDSSPAVWGGDVYVTYPGQYYAFNAATGAPVWHDDEGLYGGGGWTPVVADGHVFVEDPDTSSRVVSAASGADQGPLGLARAPAAAAGMVFAPQGTTSANGAAPVLDAVADDGLGNQVWSFDGDGTLDTPPLLIDGTVWIGSSSGQLDGVNASTGAVQWSTATGTNITGFGMGLGDGDLLVPTSDSLMAYAFSQAPASGPTPAPPAPVRPIAAPRRSRHRVAGGARAVLRHGLAVHPSLRRLIRHGQARLRLSTPSAGRLTVTWSAGGRRARHLGTARLTVTHRGRHSLVLRLSRRGVRVLKAHRRGITLIARARFVPRHGRPLTVVRRLRLAR